MFSNLSNILSRVNHLGFYLRGLQSHVEVVVGAEFGVDAETGPLLLRTAYEYSHFRYVDYLVGTTSYAGRRIPGIPEQGLMTSATLHVAGTSLSATADLAGPADVDDANSAQAPGRAVFGAAISRDLVSKLTKLGIESEGVALFVAGREHVRHVDPSA